MAYLLDTNVISEARKPAPNPNVRAWLDSVPEAELYLSVLVVGEIRQGIERLRRRDPTQAEGGSMKLRLVLTGLAVLAATIVPAAASAGQDHGRGAFLSLPPDLSTGYLEGHHHPHKDPKHPKARYRHRKLGTADNHGVDRFNGEVATIPAGALCDFAVKIRQWGTAPVLGVDRQAGRDRPRRRQPGTCSSARKGCSTRSTSTTGPRSGTAPPTTSTARSASS